MGRLAPLLLLLALPAAAQPSKPDDAEVARFFPQSLIDKTRSVDDEPRRWIAHAEVDLAGTGRSNFIVASYSTGWRAALAVLRRHTNGLAQVALYELYELDGMGGIYPEVKALDVDNDGKQEVIINYNVGNHTTIATMVFKWDGTQLRSLENHGNLSNADFIDLDGDGTLEVLTTREPFPSELENPETVYRDPIYKLRNGVYSPIPWAVAIYGNPHGRHEGPVTTDREEFRALEPASGLRMLVVNGIFGKRRVTSGSIKLNGVEVVSRRQLNQRVRYLTVPVSVKKANTIEVTVDGERPASILVLVLLPE